ncbi:KUP/HAK/KT family potassium transporter [Streptomyces sp. NBC_00258]|uniref:KUP/HAK/KT family potassium transporter n=1 Tax=Streptomyces sp. NBC_00258 TaxID=2903642 RepID=UPI002E2A50B2|nr:KUP/HAK/KT family potassium transporter [Streptomyces sp. NBC_00258]
MHRGEPTLQPSYALGLLVGRWGTAFFALGRHRLAVAGAEALYTDMRHFGSRGGAVAFVALSVGRSIRCARVRDPSPGRGDRPAPVRVPPAPPT